MDEVHIARHLEIDVVLLLQVSEYLQVAIGDFRKGGDGESRAATGDATPGTAVLLVDEDRLQAGFGEVAEQGRAGHAAAGDEGAHFLDLRIGELRGSDEGMGPREIAHIADFHEVRHRAARGELAAHLDAARPQDLLGAWEAAGTAARSHPEPGHMLEFLRGDAFAAFQSLQNLLQTHVLAVADVGFGPVGITRDHL